MSWVKYGLLLIAVAYFMRNCIDWIDPARVESGGKGVWVTVDPFRGNGDLVTDYVNAPYGKAKVKWQVHNDQGRMGLFSVQAKDGQGQTIRQICNIPVDAGSQRSDQEFLDGAPRFYLEVHATVPWEITVEAMR